MPNPVFMDIFAVWRWRNPSVGACTAILRGNRAASTTPAQEPMIIAAASEVTPPSAFTVGSSASACV